MKDLLDQDLLDQRRPEVVRSASAEGEVKK